MKSAAALFAEIERLHAGGVKQVRGRSALTGTLNEPRFTFSSGEEIPFDGKAWHFHPKELDDGERA
jgi:hypothetical protein